MKKHPYVQRTASQLRCEILLQDRSLTSMAGALGVSGSYSCAILRKPHLLKVKHVYILLEELDLPPALFFTKLYGPGRPDNETGLLNLWFEPESTPEPPAPWQQEVQRLTLLLRIKAKASPTRLRDFSTALGQTADYASQLLRGNLELRYWHVMAFLQALEMSPADLFVELHGALNPKPAPLPSPKFRRF